jgi:hypothetical protein
MKANAMNDDDDFEPTYNTVEDFADYSEGDYESEDEMLVTPTSGLDDPSEQEDELADRLMMNRHHDLLIPPTLNFAAIQRQERRERERRGHALNQSRPVLRSLPQGDSDLLIPPTIDWAELARSR